MKIDNNLRRKLTRYDNRQQSATETNTTWHETTSCDGNWHNIRDVATGINKIQSAGTDKHNRLVNGEGTNTIQTKKQQPHALSISSNSNRSSKGNSTKATTASASAETLKITEKDESSINSICGYKNSNNLAMKAIWGTTKATSITVLLLTKTATTVTSEGSAAALSSSSMHSVPLCIHSVIYRLVN